MFVKLNHGAIVDLRVNGGNFPVPAYGHPPSRMASNSLGRDALFSNTENLRGVVLSLKCTKYFGGRAPPGPAGDLSALLIPPNK